MEKLTFPVVAAPASPGLTPKPVVTVLEPSTQDEVIFSSPARSGQETGSVLPARAISGALDLRGTWPNSAPDPGEWEAAIAMPHSWMTAFVPLSFLPRIQRQYPNQTRDPEGGYSLSRQVPTLGPEQMEKLALMGPEQTGKFLLLWGRFQGQGLVLPDSKAIHPVNSFLLGWLEGGKLGQKDRHGDNALDNLHSLLTRPMVDEVGMQSQIVAEAIVQLGDPGLMRQGAKGTCAAHSAEYQLADRNASEYLRTAGNLLSDGVSTTIGQGVVAVVSDSVREDRSHRSTLNRIMQAALMDLGSDAGEFYSNRDDGFSPVQGEGKGKFHGGLYGEQKRLLLERLFGEPYETALGLTVSEIEDPDAKTTRARELALERVRRITDQSEPAHVGIDYGEGGHALLVVKVTDREVLFRNPWGHQAHAVRKPLFQGHHIYDNGFESMPRDRFQELLFNVTVPARLT